MTHAVGERGIRLRDLLRADLDHASTERRRKTVPFPRRPGREDDVRAVAILDHVAHEGALVRLEELTLGIEHRDEWNREPLAGPGVLHAAQA